MTIRINVQGIYNLFCFGMATAVQVLAMSNDYSTFSNVWCMLCVVFYGIGVIATNPFCKKEDWSDKLLERRIIIHLAVLLTVVVTIFFSGHIW